MRMNAEKLGTLSLTTITLVTLLLWLAWGIIINGLDAFYKSFESMNTVLLREWLLNRQGDFLLKVWFVGLCGLMVVLGMNLIFCTWSRFFWILRVNFNASRFLMLMVHLVFGLVALGHFAGFMLGYRYEDLRLGEGGVFRTSDGHEIRVETIQWAGDINAPRQTHGNAPKQGQIRETSFAETSISKGGRELHRDKAYTLAPVRYHDIQVTLKGFVRPVPSSGNRKDQSLKPVGLFVISKNPALRLFLFFYPLMILGIAVYLVLTWHETQQKTIKRV